VVEVAGTPAPKFQLYVSPAPTVPVFVKSTPEPTHCGAVEEKEAVGVWFTAMLIVSVAVHKPLLIVKVMSLVPEVE